MQILVTGGLGFIGSNFIEYILANNPDVVVTNVDKCDYMAREKNVNTNPRYTYIRGDITEKFHMSHIFTEFKPDIVVHSRVPATIFSVKCVPMTGAIFTFITVSHGGEFIPIWCMKSSHDILH